MSICTRSRSIFKTIQRCSHENSQKLSMLTPKIISDNAYFSVNVIDFTSGEIFNKTSVTEKFDDVFSNSMQLFLHEDIN